MQSQPVSRSQPVIRRALAATFPDYRGRKVRIARWDRPLHLDLNWSGGTIDQVVLIDLAAGRIAHLSVPAPWMHDHAPFDPADVEYGAILAVHSYVCGVDAGVTFYVRGDVTPMLEATT